MAPESRIYLPDSVARSIVLANIRYPQTQTGCVIAAGHGVAEAAANEAMTWRLADYQLISQAQLDFSADAVDRAHKRYGIPPASEILSQTCPASRAAITLADRLAQLIRYPIRQAVTASALFSCDVLADMPPPLSLSSIRHSDAIASGSEPAKYRAIQALLAQTGACDGGQALRLLWHTVYMGFHPSNPVARTAGRTLRAGLAALYTEEVKADPARRDEIVCQIDSVYCRFLDIVSAAINDAGPSISRALGKPLGEETIVNFIDNTVTHVNIPGEETDDDEMA